MKQNISATVNVLKRYILMSKKLSNYNSIISSHTRSFYSTLGKPNKISFRFTTQNQQIFSKLFEN